MEDTKYLTLLATVYQKAGRSDSAVETLTRARECQSRYIHSLSLVPRPLPYFGIATLKTGSGPRTRLYRRYTQFFLTLAIILLNILLHRVLKRVGAQQSDAAHAQQQLAARLVFTIEYLVVARLSCPVLKTVVVLSAHKQDQQG